MVRTLQIKPAAGRAVAVVACLLLTGCGGGGDGSPAPAPAPDPTPGPGQVTISGTVTYDFVPHRPAGGLDYGLGEPRPARFVTAQFVDGTDVLAATQTDANGDYSLSVLTNQPGFIRVRAESVSVGAPAWNFNIRDNTDRGALYTLDGAVASSGTADSVRDLHAGSGWTGAGYGDARAAAPFAILDSLYEAVEFLAAADPGIELPLLWVHWSPNNRPTLGLDGNRSLATGEIGTSFYLSNPQNGAKGIYLLGAEDSDTEEYDPHVILHEFAHYLEREIGRSDSIGGAHSLSDHLDMRLAFSEGWATAFAALALGDPNYRDSVGDSQQAAFLIDVESGPGSTSGWYSERSVLQIVYDLVDSGPDVNDGLIIPFSDVWSVMTGAATTTPALTSIFSFLNAVGNARPGDRPLIDLLAATQSIDPVANDYGDGETNDAGSPDVIPIYTGLTVNTVPVSLCSTDEFRTATGWKNRLATRRYIRFEPLTPGDVTITMVATSIPAGEYADPDFWVHRTGELVDPFNGINPPKGQGPPSAACEDVNGGGWTPSDCVESASFSLAAEEHILEVYEWTNADDDPDYPPIGRTCFDVTVTQP